MTKGFIFDLDGTIYLGDQLISGAKETISTLRERGDKVVFLTNKSIATRKEYVNKLTRLGIETNLSEVINSNMITALYLKEHLSNQESVYVIGERPLFDELKDHDIRITNDPKKAHFVVLGWDRRFDYDKLNTAFQAVKNGADVVATNPDRTCPMKDGGQVPDCGAMIGALEGTTGQPVEKVIGKPSRYLAQTVVNKILSLDSSDCYMVGDRLETDIRMGSENDMKSVLVLTGISSREMISQSSFKPSYVLDSVKDMIHI